MQNIRQGFTQHSWQCMCLDLSPNSRRARVWFLEATNATARCCHLKLDRVPLSEFLVDESTSEIRHLLRSPCYYFGTRQFHRIFLTQRGVMYFSLCISHSVGFLGTNSLVVAFASSSYYLLFYCSSASLYYSDFTRRAFLSLLLNSTERS